MAHDRARKVDVNSMEREQIEVLAEQVGTKVKNIFDKACEDANAILKIYGLKAKFEFYAEPLDE